MRNRKNQSFQLHDWLKASEPDLTENIILQRQAMPNWVDLPRDLTENILQRLGTVEILMSASRVCSLWWNICKDPLMWRTILIHHILSLPYKYRHQLNNICYTAIERSCNHLQDIDIQLVVTNDLLKCIANNGSHLRSMRLDLCYAISDEGFSEAVRKLPLLEKVEISMTNLTKVSLEALGRSCPLLKSLKYDTELYVSSGQPCDDLAFVIAETMSGLNHLVIDGDNLTNVGLLAILDKCPLLKSLHIKRCEHLELSDETLEKRCTNQIIDLQLNRYDDQDQDDHYSSGYYTDNCSCCNTVQYDDDPSYDDDDDDPSYDDQDEYDYSTGFKLRFWSRMR
ncbi:F-box protein skip19 [Trifolium pratense]|uniref:F-box protein skip19 n=3 Tax=Trifolium pratense TaxID=57577 RepID=A0A2K3MH66_TRIPR|nr:F-box protein skip19 [Trifolium pratense]